jgi:hypothetical protein
MSRTKDIREAVEAELDFDPLVDATNITVKNLDGEPDPARPRWLITVPGMGYRLDSAARPA